jgi:hypothetical protein
MFGLGLMSDNLCSGSAQPNRIGPFVVGGGRRRARGGERRCVDFEVGRGVRVGRGALSNAAEVESPRGA